MKKIIPIFILFAVLQISCIGNVPNGKIIHRDTIVIHDTVLVEGTFTYNIPCRVMNIHPELPGKAMLVIWLHGGVFDQKRHNFFANEHHMTWVKADDSIVEYLQQNTKKAIFLNSL